MTFTEHVHLTSLFIFKLMLNACTVQTQLYVVNTFYANIKRVHTLLCEYIGIICYFSRRILKFI